MSKAGISSSIHPFIRLSRSPCDSYPIHTLEETNTFQCDSVSDGEREETERWRDRGVTNELGTGREGCV